MAREVDMSAHGFCFVMIYANEEQTEAYPFMHTDLDVRFFVTSLDARSAMSGHDHGAKFGYEIFTMGCGEKP